MAIVNKPSSTHEEAALTADRIRELHDAFRAHPTARLMQNAVTKNTVDDIAMDRDVVTTTSHSFSNVIDDWAVTNQKRSGRCWMFAGLNLFRPAAMNTLNLKEFEFSQNYTLFWDKFERANYFLEAIIDTSDRDADDRTVAFLLDNPLEDGGQWNMFVNIIKKHGVVPKTAMPESESSSNTRRMNSILLTKLRQGAALIRSEATDGSSVESLRATKQTVLAEVHRILCIHLGTPPTSFNWQWQDKDKEFHRDGEMTPTDFAGKYLQQNLDDFVCLVHDPRPTSPVNKTFTVQYLGNVCGGDIVKYLNVDIEVIKKVTMDTLLDGQPVWMGCDVGKMMERKQGIWDANLFDYEGVYDSSFHLSKADRLIHHDTLMTHAMLFTGVDVVDGEDGPTARRWRVENSWGDENGKKGFYVMNDSWFNEYMFEIAAHKSYLPDDLLAAAEQDPIELPAWDPMGALAR